MSRLAAFTSLSGRARLKPAVIVLLVLITLLVLLRMALTPMAQTGLIRWLKNQGVEAGIENLDMNLRQGLISLQGFDMRDADGHRAHIGRLDVRWRWDELTERHLQVERVELHELYVDVVLQDAGKLNIGGLQLPLPGNENAADLATQQTDSQGKPFAISLLNIHLNDMQVCLDRQQTASPPLSMCTSLGSLDWQGQARYRVDKAATEELPLSVQGTLKLNRLQIQNRLTQRELLSLGTMHLNEIDMQGSQQLKLKQLELLNLAALQRTADTTTGHVVAFDKLELNSVHLENRQRLSMDEIRLEQMSAYVHKLASGEIEGFDSLPAGSDEADNTEQQNPPLQFALGRFVYNSDRTLVYVDDSLKESLRFDLHDTRLTIGTIDSLVPGNSTSVELQTRSGTHGEITFQADTTPLTKPVNAKGKAEINGLDLRSLSPLTRQHAGHSIRSGQLDSDITFKIDQGQVDSNINLTLNRFELRALSKQEAEALDSDFGFPLNVALALLRDRDDNIRLDIPVKGDMNQPDFDPAHAITKATSKAVSAAVVVYYSPFGMVLAADKLLNLATALRFDPVPFEAGQSVLPAQSTDQLDTLAKMLHERPGVQLTLCGISSRDDSMVIYPELAQAAEKNKSDLLSTTEQRKRLLHLAEQRSIAVKEYLVGTQGISAGRLVVCEPEFRPNERVAEVDISI